MKSNWYVIHFECDEGPDTVTKYQTNVIDALIMALAHRVNYGLHKRVKKITKLVLAEEIEVPVEEYQEAVAVLS